MNFTPLKTHAAIKSWEKHFLIFRNIVTFNYFYKVSVYFLSSHDFLFKNKGFDLIIAGDNSIDFYNGDELTATAYAIM